MTVEITPADEIAEILGAEVLRRDSEAEINDLRRKDLERLAALRRAAIGAGTSDDITRVVTVEGALIGVGDLHDVIQAYAPGLAESDQPVASSMEPKVAEETDDEEIFLKDHPNVAVFLKNPEKVNDGKVNLHDVAELFVRVDGREVDKKLRLVAVNKAVRDWAGNSHENSKAVSRKSGRRSPVLLDAHRAPEVIEYIENRMLSAKIKAYQLIDSDTSLNRHPSQSPKKAPGRH